MLWLIWVVVIALVAGMLARAITPGHQRIGCLGTIFVGWLGSFVGGFLGNLIGSGSVFAVRRSGIFGSILGAVVLLLIYEATNRSKSNGMKGRGQDA